MERTDRRVRKTKAQLNAGLAKLMKTKNTVCIHWFSGSWVSKELIQKQKKRKRAEKIDRIKHFPNRLGRKLLGDKRYEALKAKLKGN